MKILLLLAFSYISILCFLLAYHVDDASERIAKLEQLHVQKQEDLK